LEPIPAIIGERHGTPWTGRQSITGPHRDKQPLLGTILESPINLTCMFLGGGRKPAYLERAYAYTGRTFKLLGFEPGGLLL